VQAMAKKTKGNKVWDFEVFSLWNEKLLQVQKSPEEVQA
jgi:hypothetical protein